MNLEAAIARLVTELRWSPETARLGFRAGFRCEYCGRNLLRSVDDLWWTLEVDHVVPRSAGGADVEENLAFSCAQCNRLKGTWDPRTVAVDESRQELRAAARAHIRERRAEKQVELDQTRAIVASVDAADGVTMS